MAAQQSWLVGGGVRARVCVVCYRRTGWQWGRGLQGAEACQRHSRGQPRHQPRAAELRGLGGRGVPRAGAGVQGAPCAQRAQARRARSWVLAESSSRHRPLAQEGLQKPTPGGNGAPHGDGGHRGASGAGSTPSRRESSCSSMMSMTPFSSGKTPTTTNEIS